MTAAFAGEKRHALVKRHGFDVEITINRRQRASDDAVPERRPVKRPPRKFFDDPIR